MNSFGTLFKVQIFGESHGDCVGVLIDGCPAGLPLQQSHFVGCFYYPNLVLIYYLFENSK